METLVQLIQNLKPNELQVIQDLYRAKFANVENKRQLLFKLLYQNAFTPNEELAKIIYKQQPGSALSKLKERLKDDILNAFLLLPIDHLNVSSHVKSEITCRKLLLKGKILMARGILKEGILLLKKASAKAEKEELFDVSIAANDAIRAALEGTISSVMLHKINDKIQQAQDLHQRILATKGLFLKMSVCERNQQSLKQEELNTTISRLKELKTFSLSSQSKRMQFWYHLTLSRYYHHAGKENEALDCNRTLINMIRQTPYLFNHSLVSIIYYDLINEYIHKNELEKAEKCALIALDNCRDSSLEQLQILSALFTLYFREKKLDQCTRLAKVILGHPSLPHYGKIKAMVCLSQSQIEFEKGSYKASIKKLNQFNRLFKDDKQYLGLARYLELLNILELKDFDWFEYKLEAFRKFLSRVEKQRMEHLELSYRTFCCLRNNNYNFRKLKADHPGLMQQLQDIGKKEDSECQEIKGIDLAHWIESKT